MSKQPAAADSWIPSLFACIDRRDADGFAGFLADDGTFRFGNQPPVQGRVAIREAVGGFFESIAGLSHRIDRVWEDDDSVICQGEVTYERLDGSRITLPFADIFSMDGDLIGDYSIYMDVTPLFSGTG